ncbi:MAG: glutamyl-tRNA synthetase, partial [Nocardioidaceae bacterium]|nr:glutamyl-tRNA synthetase [Nocardioidaceae bacterium]
MDEQIEPVPGPVGDGEAVRVRFCPSPTGSPHVGMARTALFNWAFARHHGGTFVFRIEDTDAARDSQESYDTILEVMRWLGFDWDEGPEAGGRFGPYRQSERYPVYADVAQRLLEAGRAYHCYCSQEELDARNERARAEGRTPGYDGHCRELSTAERAAYDAEGRRPVVRFRMPDRTITFDDLVRGEISFQPEHVPDYVLVRGNGHPLYTLVNPVDDALMEITHVLRGEDLLSSTPRQIALYDALSEIDIGAGRVPRFGHLPYVMGQGNKKLSKRDPESNLLGYRDRGFLPEGLLNYLALLGWAIADDRDVFSMKEMVAAFAIERVNPNPARFDLKKAEAINATHLRALSVEELTGRLIPYLQSAELLPDPVGDEQRALLLEAAPLVHERMTTLTDAVDMLGFLFVDDASFTLDEADAAKLLDTDGRAV